ncbi:hypothetical protein V2J09_012762 [Rumex salicifolius]
MVVTGLNLAGVATPLVAERRVLAFNRSTKLADSFQVKCDGSSRSRAPNTLKVARREMALGLTAVFLTGATGNAEARVVKPEIRRKIREKLEMLREKAGLSKKKDDTKKAPPPPLMPPPLPLPTLPESSTLVEANVAIN